MNYNVARAVTRFVASLLLVILVSTVAILGFAPFNIPGVFDTNGITLGLDLAGGSLIVYEAQTDLTGDDLQTNMEAVETLIRSRLDTLGFTEATISTSGKQVSVEIPSITNPEEAIQKIGATAELQFRNADGDVIIEGQHVKEAKAQYGDYDGDGTDSYFVAIELTSEGQELFKEGTREAIGSYISIYLDEEVQSTASVTEEIDGDPIITNDSFTVDEVKWLASVINAGQLPFALEAVQQDSIGASLGEKSLESALIAGIIGLVLVMVFMIIVYRVPGVVATISLIAYTALVIIALELTKTNLTLPGIAGVILSIGMAVDANVVIYERIKEELKLGKTTKAAIESGFNRAFTAILDSNITTLIAAITLWSLGTGSVKGFGATLTFGVLISMLTAITLTRYFLRLTVNMRISKLTLYGVRPEKVDKKSWVSRFEVIKYRKAMFLIVAVILVLGIVTIAVRGFNVDIDFVGGTEFQISIDKDVTDDDLANVRTIVEETLDDDSLISSITRSVSDSSTVVIRTKLVSETQRAAIRENIINAYDLTDDLDYSVRSIGASISEALKRNAVMSAAIAIVLMLIYITFRFSFLSSISAILCLVHDLFIMVFCYSLLGVPLDSNIVATLLTILGFSVNNTIITFDRIREVVKKNPREPFAQSVNVGTKTTVTRSINTTFTTLLTIGMVYLFGVSSVKDFALPIIIGLVAGLFSSVMLSGPLWDVLKGWLGDISLKRSMNNVFKKKKVKSK